MKKNTKYPLSISTYDGSFQLVHPCVIECPEPFCGFQYWMAMTPFPNGNDAFENPSLRGSNDGINWELPHYLPDPVIPQPDSLDKHYSDPHILLYNDELHLFYRLTDRIKKRSFIFLVQSKDLVQWTSPILVYEGDWCLSPSIVFERGIWHMWFVDLVKDNRSTYSTLKIVKGQTPTSFGDETSCSVDLGKYNPWHIEVQKSETGFHALINAFPGRSELIRQSLFLVKSADGIDWTDSKITCLLEPSLFGWDNKVIYKSSFLFSLPENYKIWYSAGSWGGEWYIGYIEDALNKTKKATVQPILKLNRVSQIKQDLRGITRLFLRRFLPEYLVNLLKKIT